MAATRRRFLKALGWTAAGLTVVGGGFYLADPIPALPHRRLTTPEEAAAWLSLRPDGFIEVAMPRTEMGQGIGASFRQVVAEETGFPFDRIRTVQPNTDRIAPVRATVGSDSIKDFGPILARTAAAFGTILKTQGIVEGAEPKQGWAEFVKVPRVVDAASIQASKPISFETGAPRRVVGKSFPTDQIQDIVTGRNPVYAGDIRLPGMVYGSVLRPPKLGATLVWTNDRAARQMPGYRGLFDIDGRTFVAADTRGGLERALDAIEPQWTGGDASQREIDSAIGIDAALALGALEHTLIDGDLSGGEPYDVDVALTVPMAAHAFIEPRTAVARYERGRLDMWTGTQDVTFVKAFLCKALQMPPDKVTVHGMRTGGAFGGKTICKVEYDAALLARRLNQPVKIQWTRLEEFREGFHRPPSQHRLRMRYGGSNGLMAIHHAFRSGHVIFTSAAMGPAIQYATSFIADPGVGRGAVPPYDAAKMRVEFEDVSLPVDTGPWRGLGAASNVWAIETAMDMLAKTHNEDPYLFRRKLIGKKWPRLRRALESVATLANWTELKSGPNLGYGIACGIYKDMAYSATVAEVENNDGAIRVRRFWSAHDCGQMVNPDQVRAQIEGNLIWGLGMALSEELTLSDGHIGATNLTEYAIPRFSDIPDMTIDMIEGGDAPSGAGETAIVAAAAAVTNAIAAMTGSYVTTLPWKPKGA
jgi:CO/xanthine dehydrogenase Mo-binding subunit